MIFSWQGKSGNWFEFDVARSKRVWEPKGGVYMFVKPGDYPTMEAGGPVALYIAQTNSFLDSLARHSMWGAAQALGAGEIHLLEIADPSKRTMIEQDLLRSQTPILNRQQIRRNAAKAPHLLPRRQIARAFSRRRRARFSFGR